MKRHKLAFALSLAAALFVAPGPALAQSEPVYQIYYFSAPDGLVVGIHYGDCTPWGAQTHVRLEGETSPYSQWYVVGYCEGGVFQPL